MSSDLLQRAGEAIYGPRWQSDLARDLDVSARTMRRWVAGDPPESVYGELREICRQRMKEIGAIIAQLP